MTFFLLYIDPGSGSYFIQVIIAAVVGALFYVKNIWWKIRSFFTRNKNQENPGNDNRNE